MKACIFGVVAAVVSGAMVSGQSIIHSFDGSAADEDFGQAVGSTGDIDQDGFDDVVLGSPKFNSGGLDAAGVAYVRSGRDGSLLAEFGGNQIGELLGNSVSGGGDVNGDGFSDVVVGSPHYQDAGLEVGRVQVFSGAFIVNGTLPEVLFEFVGSQDGGDFGWDVASMGDANNDGFDDVLIGAPNFDGAGAGTRRGQASVYSGSNGLLLGEFIGDTNGGKFGWSVDGAGDMDFDGCHEFVVGAWSDDRIAASAGFVRIFTFSPFSGFSIASSYYGDVAVDRLGFSVSGAGDVNGDGVPDIIAGATQNDGIQFGQGYARVYSGDHIMNGAGLAVLHEFLGNGNATQFAQSVAGAGDVNRDGFQDLVVGAFLESSNGIQNGHVYVYSGMDGSTLASIPGEVDHDHSGEAVAAAGDVNDDGHGDILIGVTGQDDGGDSAGQVRIITGQDCPASFQNYGSGWPGTNGIPAITASNVPAAGTLITIDIQNSSGATNPGSLFLGLTQASVASAWGGTLLVDPLLVIPFQVPAAGLSLPMDIGYDGLFCGGILYLQLLQADPGASDGISFTPGLELVFGY